MKDILQDMSVEDKITLIVSHWYFIGIGTKIAAKVLGYLPDTFELRYSRHQIFEADMSMLFGRSSSADEKLYDSWTEPLWGLQGKARIDQKLRVLGKMSEIEAALRRTEARDIAAGRTTDALLQHERNVREKVYQNWREGVDMAEQWKTRYPWCLDYIPETAPVMSEKDQITVIVGLEYIWTRPHHGVDSVTHALGYQPDRLELRFARDEVVMVHECFRHGWHGYSNELFQAWSKDWASCTEPERAEQKLKLSTKVEEIKCALRETQDRELAAGKTTPSYLAAKRNYAERGWQMFWENKEEDARNFDEKQDAKKFDKKQEAKNFDMEEDEKDFDSRKIISTVAKQGQRRKIKWLKAACKDMTGKLGSNSNPSRTVTKQSTGTEKADDYHRSDYKSFNYDCIESDDECSIISH